jgi:hypothetical protein
LTYGAPATGAALDLRNEVEVKRANKYTYDTKRMASIIRSRYAEASGLDFTGLDCQLTVPNNIDNVVEKEYVIDQFTADLNYINESPGSISDSGFVIVVAEKAYDMPLDSYRVVNYLCPLTNSVQTNGLLALTTLYSKFFIYGMPFASVNINGANVVTTKTLKNKLQESFNVAWCNGNYTPYVLFRTGLGYGFPETMEFNLTERRMNIQLLQL